MKSHSPAAVRNASPLQEVLSRFVESGTRVLEIASGSGQHAAHMSEAFPGCLWQPSDADRNAVRSISAYQEEAGREGFLPPVMLDVHEVPWSVGEMDLVFCANMIHISPWTSCLALGQGASACLRDGGRLITYGPYLFDDVETAASNIAFDQSLRQRDPRWGIRSFRDVAAAFASEGLRFRERIEMPANNACLVFEKADE